MGKQFIGRRSIQLKKKYENDLPEALENIEKAQTKQVKSQNNQHNVTDTPFEKGTKVFLKSPQIQGKMEAKFQGPYTIDSQTPNGNYWLINCSNKKLKQSYPLSRLIIVDESVTEDTYYDIETILKDRVRNHVKEFFVKWKGYPESDNSWVKESDFVSMEAIEEYKENQQFYCSS